MFDDDRSSFAGLPLKDCSLNDLLGLLEVALPARFLEKLSVCRARELNILCGLDSARFQTQIRSRSTGIY